jgi:hypothetical protein
MINYSLTFTGKADKDEADIYKYITEKSGGIYADKFLQALFSFVAFSVSNLLLADPQKMMHH